MIAALHFRESGLRTLQCIIDVLRGRDIVAAAAAAAVAPPPAALQQMKRILHAAALMPPSFGIGDGSQRAAILRGGLVGRAWRLFTIIWVRSQ